MSRRRKTSYVVHVTAAEARAIAARERRDAGIGCAVLVGSVIGAQRTTCQHCSAPVR